MVVVLLGTLAFSNAYAGSFNIGTVQYNGKNTHFTNKEKNDPYTGGEFTLTNGSPRRIIMTTFSRDLKTLYQSGLVVRENEGYKKTGIIVGNQVEQEQELLFRMVIMMVE